MRRAAFGKRAEGLEDCEGCPKSAIGFAGLFTYYAHSRKFYEHE
jgi:hypothetical protein